MVLTTAEGVLGGALAARPASISEAVAGPGPAAPAWVTRLLGLRMAAQSLAVVAGGRRGDARPVLVGGAAVDAIHAASMVAVSVWKGAYRRSALLSAGTASVFALAAGLAAARGPATGAGGPHPPAGLESPSREGSR